MISKVVFAVAIVAVFIQVLPSDAQPLHGCCGPPLCLPLPLPSTIPLGNFCTCKPVALKPTLLPAPACGCPPPCGLGLNPLLLKQLLPYLLPSLLGGAHGCC